MRAREELASQAPPGVQVLAVPGDISRPGDVERLVDRTLAELGGIDVLVANAGIYGPQGRFEEVDWDEWVAAIQVNLLGTALTCRAVLPHLRARGGGKIIVLSGGGATKPMPFLARTPPQRRVSSASQRPLLARSRTSGSLSIVSAQGPSTRGCWIRSWQPDRSESAARSTRRLSGRRPRAAIRWRRRRHCACSCPRRPAMGSPAG